MLKRLILTIVVMVSLLSLLTACGEQQSAPGKLVMNSSEHDAWEISLVEMRIERNEEYSNPADSVLPADRLASFEGLEYYFPNAELVFKTQFVALAGTDTVYLTKRQGQEVPYLKRGTVAFTYAEIEHSLAVFGPVDDKHGDYLWLPFFDQTNGETTYGGGRYLDIEVDDTGSVMVDFNYAYNPLCDYNPQKFNCTLPPAGNKLGFKVEAGEKSLNPEH